MILKGEKLSLKNCSKYNYLDEEKYYYVYHKRLSKIGYSKYYLRESQDLCLQVYDCHKGLKYYNKHTCCPFLKYVHIIAKIHL
jgi:hypothetical protein